MEYKKVIWDMLNEARVQINRKKILFHVVPKNKATFQAKFKFYVEI